MLAFLTGVFPRVELWFSWFNTTLANQEPRGTYMWQDVSKEGALSSGLDDYPRGYRIVQKGAVHADLQLWMISFAKFMAGFVTELEALTNKTVGNRTSDDYKALSSLASNQLRA